MQLALEAFIRLAPVLAAVLALCGVWVTVRQKAENDRRDQWWKRVQWATDLVRSGGDSAQALGLAALTAMIEEGPVNDGDAQLLEAIINEVLDTLGPGELELGGDLEGEASRG